VNKIIIIEKQLIDAAKVARQNSYSPYSRFAVGAAILTKSGKIFTGCNVENSSFRLTICAEQAAVAAAVSAGEKDFVKVAIVTDLAKPAMPCGACRQTLGEFGSGLEIITANTAGIREVTTLAALLPHPFEGMEDSNAF
jgi:cytidine deaminase